MKYENLQELIAHSSSSRSFFLSLPVALQLLLHEHSSAIHTAADLHLRADQLQKMPRFLRRP